MAADRLPYLIVGDVHGDFERLFAALKPYPAEEWRTIFLGDLVDFGAFGVGCLRFARDRKNSEVLLGNHEVAMLSALHDPSRVGFYISIGGQQHDLDELRKDDPLQAWIKARPLLLKLEDGTLVQHCGNDDYRMLLGEERSNAVGTINTNGRLVLEAGDAHLLWDVMSGRVSLPPSPIASIAGSSSPARGAWSLGTRRTTNRSRRATTAARRSTTTAGWPVSTTAAPRRSRRASARFLRRGADQKALGGSSAPNAAHFPRRGPQQVLRCSLTNRPMRSLRCSSLRPNLGHLDRRISRRGVLAAPQATAGRQSLHGRYPAARASASSWKKTKFSCRAWRPW